jgi:hypothetical protein
MAAEEFALVRPFTDEEQQVAVSRLHVEDGDLSLGPRLADDLEELALAVSLQVEGDDPRRAAAPGRTISDLQASANAGKLDVKEVRVHEEKDTIRAQRVRNHPKFVSNLSPAFGVHRSSHSRLFFAEERRWIMDWMQQEQRRKEVEKGKSESRTV